MPIEFACESCSRLLRVPDGTAGQACECPACGILLEIPDPDRIKVMEDHQAGQGSQFLNIPCPKCHHELRCPPKLLGTKGQCRKCQYIFLISENPQSTSSATETGPSGWVFTCPKCDQLFEGQPEMRGRKGKCHVCGEVFAIELRKAESPQQTTETKSPTRQPLPQRSQPNSPRQSVAAKQPAQPSSIQLACGSCEGVMEVPASAGGQTTQCPFCSAMLQIPELDATGAPVHSGLSSPNSDSTSPGLSSPYPDAYTQPSSFNQPAGGLGQNVAPAGNLWTDLGDLSGAMASSNPYAAPETGGWSSGSTPKKRNRGLSFTNVFRLAFQKGFPNVILASLIYLLIGAINYGVQFGTTYLLRYIVESFGQEAVWVVWIGLAFMLIVSLSLGTFAVTTIARAALMSIRGEKEGVFSSEAYFLPMLACLLLMGLIGACLGAFFGVVMVVIAMVLGKNAVAGILIGIVYLVAVSLIGSALCHAPMAVVDDYGPLDAIGISFKLWASNPLVLIATFLCSILITALIFIGTLGIGVLLFSALPFFVFAASYHLGTK